MKGEECLLRAETLMRRERKAAEKSAAMITGSTSFSDGFLWSRYRSSLPFELFPPNAFLLLLLNFHRTHVFMLGVLSPHV